MFIPLSFSFSAPTHGSFISLFPLPCSSSRTSPPTPPHEKKGKPYASTADPFVTYTTQHIPTLTYIPSLSPSLYEMHRIHGKSRSRRRRSENAEKQRALSLSYILIYPLAGDKDSGSSRGDGFIALSSSALYSRGPHHQQQPHTHTHTRHHRPASSAPLITARARVSPDDASSSSSNRR